MMSRLERNSLTLIVGGAKLQKLLTPMEAEYHGLVKAVDQHLSESVRSPELREQTRSIQRVWSSLQELVMSDWYVFINMAINHRYKQTISDFWLTFDID